MPARQPVEFSVTWNQVAAFRLSRQHLLPRTPVRAVFSVLLTEDRDELAQARCERSRVRLLSYFDCADMLTGGHNVGAELRKQMVGLHL